MTGTALDRVLGKLEGVKANGAGFMARCPVHEASGNGHRPSLSVKQDGDRVLLKCFGGCETAAVLGAIGLNLRDLFADESKPKARTKTHKLGPIVATYDYHDWAGALIYQTCRYAEPEKDFRQRRPDGRGGWAWSLNGVSRVLFDLPGLVDRTDVFQVEGEKDALALKALGLVATTTAGGADGYGRGDYAAQLVRAGCLRLTVLPDHDDAGRRYAEAVAASCSAAGLAVKVIELPGLRIGGDVSDWLAAGHTREELVALVDAAPVWAPAADASSKTRAPLDAGDHNLPRATAALLEALEAANVPPELFRFGGVPVRLERDERGAPRVIPLTEDRLRHHAARAAEWVIYRRQDRSADAVAVPALPPVPVIRDVLACPNLPFPMLERIVEAPCFGADGRAHLTPGYLPESGLYLAMPDGFTVPDLPAVPTEADVRAARELLLELLEDFPFTGPPELAHALAVLLLPFLRNLIPGPTPFHLIEKPTPGTGASLLADVLLLPATGRPLAAMTEGRDEDEWRKRLTAKLATSPTAIVIDNLRRPLEASAVASAITMPVWEDRLLGGSTIARVPVRCVWLGTGNNPRLSNEMARRTVRIRLDARVERPWLREGFRHPDLRGWALAQRPALVHAALVFGQAWVAAGRPRSSARLGMFEDYAAIVGGVLAVAGVGGFLENLEEFYEASDSEADAWRALVARWVERFGTQPVGVGRLWELVNPGPGGLEPVDLPLGDGSERSQRTKLGVLVRAQRGRVIGGHRVEPGPKVQGAQQWRLVPVA